ncbi:MAG: hypothetical protein B7X71_07620 [Polynucleobacter sp. 39-46-10]|nr:MAG: hypothetical protein B7X71_07620 [Polynucleobacter sp. 39-46-10]
MDLSGGIADAEMRLSVLKVSCFRTLTVFIGLTDKIKPPEGGFGNAFGNKSVVLPQTLVIPIDLAEEVSNHPYVGFRRLCIGVWANRRPKPPNFLKIARIT